jgi:hypothetical protein
MNNSWMYPEDEHWDWFPEDETPKEKKARLMRDTWEMNHAIPREERSRFIAESASILEWHGREDYRD